MKNYNKYTLIPIKKPYNNFTFTAPKGMDNCIDLHVTKTKQQIVSTWKLRSFWERLKFLFNGEITLVIWGQGMPPVSLVNRDILE